MFWECCTRLCYLLPLIHHPCSKIKYPFVLLTILPFCAVQQAPLSIYWGRFLPFCEKFYVAKILIIHVKHVIINKYIIYIRQFSLLFSSIETRNHKVNTKYFSLGNWNVAQLLIISWNFKRSREMSFVSKRSHEGH